MATIRARGGRFLKKLETSSDCLHDGFALFIEVSEKVAMEKAKQCLRHLQQRRQGALPQIKPHHVSSSLLPIASRDDDVLPSPLTHLDSLVFEGPLWYRREATPAENAYIREGLGPISWPSRLISPFGNAYLENGFVSRCAYFSREEMCRVVQERSAVLTQKNRRQCLDLTVFRPNLPSDSTRFPSEA